MANQYDSDDFLEKPSRISKKKHKTRAKERNLDEDEFPSKQKKTNFKRYLADALEESLDDENLDEYDE